MKEAANHNSISVHCRILPEDYENMAYCYDCGMVDITTQNPAAIALKRVIGGDHHVEVHRVGHNGPYTCIIDGTQYEPSKNLEEALERAEHGIYLNDFSFEINIPAQLIGNQMPEQIEPTEDQSARGCRAA